eukprot:m.233998 g.233998  ORF g.233998 m.233998 type:complete len:53 (-) comp121163_c0_seq1:43-201(-)
MPSVCTRIKRLAAKLKLYSAAVVNVDAAEAAAEISLTVAPATLDQYPQLQLD